MLGAVRVSEQVIDEVAALSEASQQHVACFRVDGDEASRVGAEVVLGKLRQVPVFEFTAPVAFVQAGADGAAAAAAAKWHSTLVLQRIRCRREGQENE